MSLYYTYDDAGNLSNIRYIIDSIGYQHNYYPVCNSRGDVETIYDYHGNVSAKYTYDAWGLIFSITDADGNEIYDEMHIGKLNPFRYRGYYYDTETGIYYLQSRYYVPFLRRFFNADSQLNPGTGLTGTNMFAYANNNPVKYSDSNGQLPFLAITGAIGAVIGAVAGGVIAKKTGRSVWKGAAIGAAGGALLGLGVGAGLGMISGAGALATAGKVVAGIGTVISTQIDRISQIVQGSYQKTVDIVNKGYNSFSQLKSVIGSPGVGSEWHHIVEQSQINKSGLSPQMINNVNNIISINQDAHRAISGYYSSIQPFSEDLRVRDWLAGKSFQAQYEFGLGVIELFK
ncbi:MAG: RHS repeat-associated core domain-containing protein [Acutalibacteraceae bacterium]